MEHHVCEKESSTGCPVFASQAERTRYAAEWVEQNRAMLTQRIVERHFGISPMDLEDFLGDTVLVAHDATIMAERKGIHWHSVFWVEFTHMIKNAQTQHYVDCDPFEPDSILERELLSFDMAGHLMETEERWIRERREDFALRSALPLLTDTERRIVELVCGLTEHGHLSSYDAGEILGLQGNNVRVVLSRAIQKIEQAGRLHFNSGDVMLFAVKWKRADDRRRKSVVRQVGQTMRQCFA